VQSVAAPSTQHAPTSTINCVASSRKNNAPRVSPAELVIFSIITVLSVLVVYTFVQFLLTSAYTTSGWKGGHILYSLSRPEAVAKGIVFQLIQAKTYFVKLL